MITIISMLGLYPVLSAVVSSVAVYLMCHACDDDEDPEFIEL